MKKLPKPTLRFLSSATSVGLKILFCALLLINCNKNNQPDLKINLKNLESEGIRTDYTSYLHLSYESSRSQFIRLANGQGLEVASYPQHFQPDGDFTTDVCLIGESNAEKMLVVSSGIHGLEGFSGSALQSFVLDNLYHYIKFLPADIAILFIHALNPSGMHDGTRVDRNRIEPNRNFLKDFTNLPKNPIYEAHQDFFRQTWNDVLTPVKTLLLYSSLSEEEKSGLFIGQYSDPMGIEYGGSEKSQTYIVFEQIVGDYCTSAKFILYFDLHTGLAEAGQVNVFHSYPAENSEEIKLLKFIFPYRLEGLTQSTLSTQTVNGDNIVWFENTLEKGSNCKVTTATIELGIKNETLSGLDLLKESLLTRELSNTNDDKHRSELEKQLEELRNEMMREYNLDYNTYPAFMDGFIRNALGCLQYLER